MKYTYSNSSILEPKCYRQYCSDDGNFVVIPSGKKYALIIEGKVHSKLYRKFDTALKEMLKYQKQSIKKKKK